MIRIPFPEPVAGYIAEVWRTGEGVVVTGPLRAMDGPKRAYRDVLVGVSRNDHPVDRATPQQAG